MTSSPWFRRFAFVYGTAFAVLYVVVDVKPGEKTKMTLNRFRPGSSEPFATVELFK